MPWLDYIERISQLMVRGYTDHAMTKRLVEIDDAVLEEAKRILGTKTIKDTVNEALLEVAKRELRMRHFERLRKMEGLDLNDPEVMKGAWRIGGRSS